MTLEPIPLATTLAVNTSSPLELTPLVMTLAVELDCGAYASHDDACKRGLFFYNLQIIFGNINGRKQ
jgi:hypothetical protein